MLDIIPNEAELTALVGKELYDERLKFEADRENYPEEIREKYDEAQTYHDGKWILFEPVDTTLFPGFMRLLEIKRKPNRK